MRRRSCASTRNTYRIWNRMVGTVKKSTETIVFTWLSREVRQVCEGGLWRRTRYLLTLPVDLSNRLLPKRHLDRQHNVRGRRNGGTRAERAQSNGETRQLAAAELVAAGKELKDLG